MDGRVGMEYDTRMYYGQIELRDALRATLGRQYCVIVASVVGSVTTGIPCSGEKNLPDEKSFHMTPEEFRRHGHAVVDWIADYYAQHRVFPGALAGEAGTDPRLVACRSAGQRRILRRDPGRCRAAHPARHHPLAVAELLRLLSLQCFRARDPGRPAFVRAGRARHAVGHQPGLHRTGNARPRLAGPHAGPAARSSFPRARAAA